MIAWETREEWGAKPPKNRRTDVAPKGIAIHWPGPGSFAKQSHTRCREVMRSWQAMHMNKGSNDIEYGLIVCPHLKVMEARIEKDKPNVRVGSNGTADANYRFSSIQLMRGSGDGPPTDAEIQTIAEVVAWLRKTGGWKPVVDGHRDHVSTACPGDALYQRLPEISRLADKIADGGGDGDGGDMDDETMNRLVEKIWRRKVFPSGSTGEDNKWAARGYIKGIWGYLRDAVTLLGRIDKNLALLVQQGGGVAATSEPAPVLPPDSEAEAE